MTYREELLSIIGPDPISIREFLTQEDGENCPIRESTYENGDDPALEKDLKNPKATAIAAKSIYRA